MKTQTRKYLKIILYIILFDMAIVALFLFTILFVNFYEYF